jgi:hypothetical protein
MLKEILCKHVIYLRNSALIGKLTKAEILDVSKRGEIIAKQLSVDMER